ncbi:efflux RND transporter periplasmic adaptor subunit [Fusobacterium varium]|uniref:efflux RND transporter periplasmic adaptor subunit n=1 Tax=Fusobacterium varium TaxID=856 RepID=UPI000E405E5B|nr:efflux RND transporter periplasmic adaptor subunit [Fusobacterium varium]MDY4005983.1 efflux RND transporter periplasmic adaptor subunit [Fusobacterium varium]RGJ28619.1 efflux RND transporter periplasmic adaptor subunit [Fusobacterium varium]
MKKQILMILILAAIISACGKKEQEYKYDMAVRPVVYKIAKKTDENISKNYVGVIKSQALSSLSFRVSGTIEKRMAQLGDHVKKGEVLAVLDPTEYKVNYQKALAELEKGKAGYTEAKSNYERAQALYLENSISKASYDNAIASYRSAAATMNALKNSVDLAKIQLGYTELKAPAEGTIGEVKSEVNQSVNPQTPVFILNTSGDKTVEFNVSESAIPTLKEGEKVLVTVDFIPEVLINGKITNIGTVSNEFGNTYPVKAKLEDAPENIRVGMTANVLLESKENKNITIPFESILKDSENRPYVYIITDIDGEIGHAVKRLVKTGEINQNGIEILDGIQSGEYIIIKGVSQIQNGQEVSLLEGVKN